MKTSINLKTSKMKNKYLKLGMMAAVMLSASIGFAQTAPADAATNAGIQKDAGAGESVREEEKLRFKKQTRSDIAPQ